MIEDCCLPRVTLSFGMPSQAYPSNNQIPHPNTEEMQARQVFQQLASNKPPLQQGKKKKKLILFGSIGLSLLLLVGIYAAIFANKPAGIPTTTEVTIRFWSKSIEEDVMADVISDFEAENPLIKVIYEKQSETDYKERLKTRLELKNVSALPDLVELDEVWIPELYKNLTGYTSTGPFERFSKQGMKNNAVTNTVYGVPFKFDSIALAYNIEHLAEIGLDETDFNRLDWSSLLLRSKNLTKTKKTKLPNSSLEYDQIIRAGIGIGSPATVTNADTILQLLLVQNEAAIYDPVKKAFTLGPKFDEVMNFYTNFAMEGAWDDSLGNDITAFAKGDVSMVLVRPADIDTIVALNPKLKFNTVLPAKIGGISDISLSTSLAMPKSRPYQQQAQKFVEYLSRPDTGTKLFMGENRNTFVPSQLESLNEIPKDSPFAVYSDIAPSVEKFVSPDFEETSKILRNSLTQGYKDTFGKLTNGQKPVRFIMSSAVIQQDLNNLVKVLNPTPSPTAVK
jgi:ABC-type glycerol-3-phosphate transport system substrate-binding protein